MQLTMRQVLAFLDAIKTRNTTNEYYRMSFMASLHRAEIPSLEEVLNVGSEETSEFDEQTDKAMEARALQLLEERRKMRNV